MLLVLVELEVTERNNYNSRNCLVNSKLKSFRVFFLMQKLTELLHKSILYIVFIYCSFHSWTNLLYYIIYSIHYFHLQS